MNAGVKVSGKSTELHEKGDYGNILFMPAQPSVVFGHALHAFCLLTSQLTGDESSSFSYLRVPSASEVSEFYGSRLILLVKVPTALTLHQGSWSVTAVRKDAAFEHLRVERTVAGPNVNLSHMSDILLGQRARTRRGLTERQREGKGSGNSQNGTDSWCS